MNDNKIQQIIYINGYYINYGQFESYFDSYKCIIGEWDGNEDDWDIFYYFADDLEIKEFMNTENRTDTEFVITNIYDENGNEITDRFKN